MIWRVRNLGGLKGTGQGPTSYLCKVPVGLMQRQRFDECAKVLMLRSRVLPIQPPSFVILEYWCVIIVRVPDIVVAGI